MKLTQGMFGSEFGAKKENPFKLQTGQMRAAAKMTHNSGWYNAAGEKIGWGDLAAYDMLEIKYNLEPNEVFIVLSESDSFWNFVMPGRIALIGSMCETEPTEQSPGSEYVMQKMSYVITQDDVFYVTDDEDSKMEEWFVGDILVIPISRSQMIGKIKEICQ